MRYSGAVRWPHLTAISVGSGDPTPQFDSFQGRIPRLESRGCYVQSQVIRPRIGILLVNPNQPAIRGPFAVGPHVIYPKYSPRAGNLLNVIMPGPKGLAIDHSRDYASLPDSRFSGYKFIPKII
jgi:hypothetical protein